MTASHPIVRKTCRKSLFRSNGIHVCKELPANISSSVKIASEAKLTRWIKKKVTMVFFTLSQTKASLLCTSGRGIPPTAQFHPFPLDAPTSSAPHKNFLIGP
jgi:hypothetical protein